MASIVTKSSLPRREEEMAAWERTSSCAFYIAMSNRKQSLVLLTMVSITNTLSQTSYRQDCSSSSGAGQDRARYYGSTLIGN